MNTLLNLFSLIESNFETSRSLNNELVDNFFKELKKNDTQNSAVVKELIFLFGIGENDYHIVDSKECRKIFLVDFKKCRKLLENFVNQPSF